MKHKGHLNNNIQNYKKINSPDKIHQNEHTNGQFPIGIISFWASQPIKAGDDISFNVIIIKHYFGKIGEKYTLWKSSNITSSTPKSPDIAINDVMETTTKTSNKHTDRTEPVHMVTDEDDLLSICDQYSKLMSPILD